MRKIRMILLAAAALAFVCGAAWATDYKVTSPSWGSDPWDGGDWEIEIDMPFAKIKEISIDSYIENWDDTPGWKLILTDADVDDGSLVSKDMGVDDIPDGVELVRASATASGSKVIFNYWLLHDHIRSKTEKTGGYSPWGEPYFRYLPSTIRILATDGSLSISRVMFLPIAAADRNNAYFTSDEWIKDSDVGLTLKTEVPVSEFANGNYMIVIDRVPVRSSDCTVSAWQNKADRDDCIPYDASLITLRPPFLDALRVGRHSAAVLTRYTDIDWYWRQANDPNGQHNGYRLLPFTIRAAGGKEPIVPSIRPDDRRRFEKNVVIDLGAVIGGKVGWISDDISEDHMITSPDRALSASDGYDQSLRDSVESVFAVKQPIAAGGHIKVGSGMRLAPHINSHKDRAEFAKLHDVRKYFAPGIYIDLLMVDGAVTYSQQEGLVVVPMVIIINEKAPAASDLPEASRLSYHTRGDDGQFGLLMGADRSVMYIWDGTPDAVAHDPISVTSKGDGKTNSGGSGGGCETGLGAAAAIAVLAVIRRRAK